MEPPTLAVASANSIRATWVAPNDNGSPITNYVLCYREVGTTTYFGLFDISLTLTTYTVTGLLNTSS